MSSTDQPIPPEREALHAELKARFERARRDPAARAAYEEFFVRHQEVFIGSLAAPGDPLEVTWPEFKQGARTMHWLDDKLSALDLDWVDGWVDSALINGKHGMVSFWLAHPSMRRLREVWVQNLRDGELAQLPVCPGLRALRLFGFGGDKAPAHTHDLGQALPALVDLYLDRTLVVDAPLAALERLHVVYPTPDHAASMCTVEWVALEELELSGEGLDTPGLLRMVLAELRAPRLRKLLLGMLDMSAALEVLIDSPLLTRLKRLQIRRDPLPERAVDLVLSHRDAFEHLEGIELCYSPVEGFESLQTQLPVEIVGPGADTPEKTQFRCTNCGTVRAFRYMKHRLRLSRRRGDSVPACKRCGQMDYYVQVGSTTEFYAFWNRDNVCRVGEHVAEGVVEYTLVRDPPVEPSNAELSMTALKIRACPDHAEQLREGWLGFVLRD
ncbi:MAG: hypothetical protein AAGF11_27245 [Myxococcota bacterium]